MSVVTKLPGGKGGEGLISICYHMYDLFYSLFSFQFFSVTG